MAFFHKKHCFRNHAVMRFIPPITSTPSLARSSHHALFPLCSVCVRARVKMRRQRAPGERCFTSFGPPPRATAGGRLSYCQPQRGSHKTCRHTRTHILLYSHRTHGYYTSQFCALHHNHVYRAVWTCGDAFFFSWLGLIRMEAFTLRNACK